MDRNALYKAYLKEKKKKQKDDKTIKKYNLSKNENTIVINNSSNKGIKFLSLLMEIVRKLLKIIFIIGVVGLVTIGATVILNKEILNYVLNYIGW